MAFEFTKQADGVGVPFNYTRGNPIPLDSWSLFMTEADAKTYATSNPVSYPGQVISVIDGTTPKVFVISNHEVQSQRKLIPVGSGSSQSSSNNTTNTCGQTCCVWFNNPVSKDAVFTDSDTWLFVDGNSHVVPADIGNATEVEVDGVKGYRVYIPAHIEDDAGNWIEGYWSNWTLFAADGSEIEVKTQSFDSVSKIWTLSDGADNYVSEESGQNIIVVTLTKEGTQQKFLAKRDWISD